MLAIFSGTKYEKSGVSGGGGRKSKIGVTSFMNDPVPEHTL